MITEWIMANIELYYTLIGMAIMFILVMALKIVYILRTTPRKSTSSDLQQIKSVIENNTYVPNPKYKFIKNIEVVDLDDKETDTTGNSE